MKKLLLFSLLVLTMVSCTINEDEPDTYWKIVNVTVDAEDWRRYTDNNGLNPFYACEIDMPEFTSQLLNDGMIQTYFVSETTPRYQGTLPYVRHYENNEGNTWTTTTDCTYGLGTMTFYVTHSDFANVPPGDMSFRVVIMW